MSLDLSVLIPTRGRPERLARCLELLARQSLPSQAYEVLVGLDGGDEHEASLAERAWLAAGGTRGALVVRVCEHTGLAAVRNAMLPLVRGRVLLSLNDDLLAEPDLLREHVLGHDESRERVCISGDSPWVLRGPQTLWTRMLQESSVVFFYHRMHANRDERKDWGYRHAWGLNMSLPREDVLRVGGFTQFPSWYGYEDNEIVYKMIERLGPTPVRFRPAARGWHDHPLSPREYLLREYKLGYAALGFARTSPACARDMFRRDISSDEEQARAAEISRGQEQAARALLGWFLGLDASEPGSEADVQSAYDRHLPLKRWVWNMGLRDAFAALDVNPRGMVAASGEVVVSELLGV